VAKVEQVVRVLALIQELATSRRGVSIARFAANKGWAERTVYNDVKKIEAAGFPLTSDRGRWHFVDGWTPPPQAGLDRDEALALFVARQLFGGAHATSLGRALDRLQTKLSGQRSDAPSLTAAGGISIRPPLSIDYTPHEATISTLEQAIKDQAVVRCRFVRSGTGEITRREIEPGELHLDPALETLYLIAWCRLRQAVRVFAVHRMTEVERTGQTCEPRAETRSAVALESAFRIWRSEHVRRVRLRFSGSAALEIRERIWHKSQTLEEMPDGEVRLTMEIAHVRELERWLLGFGELVRVEEPGVLARRVAEIHQRAAEAMGVEAPRGDGARKSAGRWQGWGG
jgi:predicted DNA-binding transcriptional regulator YafY